MTLELTVSREQVEEFFSEDYTRTGFREFMEDSQKDGPTQGIYNYAGGILGLAQRARYWNWLPVTDNVKEFFQSLGATGCHFEYSLTEIIGSNPSRDVFNGIKTHYDSLYEISERLKECLSLEVEYPDVSELNISHRVLSRQLKIVNILFDPKKRDWRFRQLIWGAPLEFDRYIDSLPE